MIVKCEHSQESLAEMGKMGRMFQAQDSPGAQVLVPACQPPRLASLWLLESHLFLPAPLASLRLLEPSGHNPASSLHTCCALC